MLGSEPILPIRRIRKLRRAPETPGGPLSLKDVFILAWFLKLASGYETMNNQLFECGVKHRQMRFIHSFIPRTPSFLPAGDTVLRRAPRSPGSALARMLFENHFRDMFLL